MKLINEMTSDEMEWAIVWKYHKEYYISFEENIEYTREIRDKSKCCFMCILD